MRANKPPRPSLRRRLRRLAWRCLQAALVTYALLCVLLLLLRFVDPPTTAVQAQRRVESWFSTAKYTKRYTPVSLNRISPHLAHAVVAAEDARFYTHRGFDWTELGIALEEDLEEGRLRGASTISQQLVKNLFFTTRGGFLRKGAEFLVVPAAELILGKKRILELYLSVIEWGPGIYGAEAAARFHYSAAASALSRDQSARLAAVLPSPRRRKPARMDRYSAIILNRMSQMGW